MDRHTIQVINVPCSSWVCNAGRDNYSICYQNKRMPLWTTVQILQVCEPHRSVRSQLVLSTLLDLGQNRQTAALLRGGGIKNPVIKYVKHAILKW